MAFTWTCWKLCDRQRSGLRNQWSPLPHVTQTHPHTKLLPPPSETYCESVTCMTNKRLSDPPPHLSHVCVCSQACDVCMWYEQCVCYVTCSCLVVGCSIVYQEMRHCGSAKLCTGQAYDKYVKLCVCGRERDRERQWERHFLSHGCVRICSSSLKLVLFMRWLCFKSLQTVLCLLFLLKRGNGASSLSIVKETHLNRDTFCQIIQINWGKSKSFTALWRV